MPHSHTSHPRQEPSQRHTPRPTPARRQGGVKQPSSQQPRRGGGDVHGSRAPRFRTVSCSELRATRRSHRERPSGGAPRSTDRLRPAAAPRLRAPHSRSAAGGRRWLRRLRLALAQPLSVPCPSRPEGGGPWDAPRAASVVCEPRASRCRTGVPARPAAASGRLSHFCYSSVPPTPKKPTVTWTASKEVRPAGRGR